MGHLPASLQVLKALQLPLGLEIRFYLPDRLAPVGQFLLYGMVGQMGETGCFSGGLL